MNVRLTSPFAARTAVLRRPWCGPRPYALICAVLTLPAPAYAQAPADHADRVDEIFAEWDSNTSPGCAVGVVQDGITVLEEAYGMAELEFGIPNTPETIFEGGSLSKQFTAAAAALLALDGELSLDDDVRDYVPELPDYGHAVTLRHLMTHTSGLRDWGSVASISGWGRGERSHDHDDVVDILSRQTALNFEPGHEYSYSNSGYNLLAIVVARVSGMSFADFSMERIFEPLGLRNTQWRDDYRRIVPGRSTAYDDTDTGWEIDRPIEHVHGNGGILTTVGDLGIWSAALEDGRLGGPDFVRMMHERGRLADGSEIVYAGGLRVEPYLGVPSVTHTGSTAGYRAFLGRYPEQELSVAMLCNAANVSTSGNGTAVARIYLGDEVEESVPNTAPPVAGGPPLSAFAGLYADPVTGDAQELEIEGGRLMDGGTTLVRTGTEDFVEEYGSTRYLFDVSGSRATGFEVDDWQYTEQRYERVEPWSPSADELQQYAGTYHSDDAETTYRVYVEDGRLTVWQRPDDTETLEPIYADAFEEGGSVVRFRRGSGGRVEALSLSIGRVYDMRFERIGG